MSNDIEKIIRNIQQGIIKTDEGDISLPSLPIGLPASILSGLDVFSMDVN